MNDQILRVKVKGFKKGAKMYWEERKEEYSVTFNDARETMTKELTNLWDRYGSITSLEFRLEEVILNSKRRS